MMKVSFYILITFMCFSCSQKLMVKSYPSRAEVKVSNTSGTKSKTVGNTPLKLKIDKDYGDLFFIELNAPKYKTKRILVNINNGSNLKIDTKLEVLEEYTKRLEKAASNVSSQQKALKDFYDKESKLFKTIEANKDNIDNIETQVAIYRSMLFSEKYSKGVANFDKDRLDQIIELVNRAKKEERNKQINSAIKLVTEALLIDSNNIYLYEYLSILYKKNNNNLDYEKALSIAKKLKSSVNHFGTIEE